MDAKLPVHKVVAGLYLLGAVLLTIVAVVTLVNLVLISMRPETISVVNTIIGQGVIIICLLALARILLRKGLRGFRDPTAAESDS